jgi:hypothetical protein
VRSTKALRRRLANLSTKIEAEAERESWRGKPERQWEVHVGYELSFMQTCFVFGGFRDLARRWAYACKPGYENALLHNLKVWIIRYNVGREEGLAEPIRINLSDSSLLSGVGECE